MKLVISSKIKSGIWKLFVVGKGARLVIAAMLRSEV